MAIDLDETPRQLAVATDDAQKLIERVWHEGYMQGHEAGHKVGFKAGRDRYIGAVVKTIAAEDSQHEQEAAATQANGG